MLLLFAGRSRRFANLNNTLHDNSSVGQDSSQQTDDGTRTVGTEVGIHTYT